MKKDYTKDLQSFGIAPEMLAEAMGESFADMLNDTFSGETSVEGSVVKGIIVEIDGDTATVDIGMKSEGRISLREFAEAGKDGVEISVGDEVTVFVDALDNRKGEARLSREKARREAALDSLEKAHADETTVKGVIFGKVKGGFTVDVQGVLAFLPGSQVDVRPIKDVSPLMNTPLDFQILKLDRKRCNLIVSRRAIMDDARSDARDELMKDMGEGKVLEGVVKNITDYGAFVDLGGVDGLLHITDISWHRINHPSEVLSLGQVLKVQVIRYNDDTKRVSLGMKQLEEDPWAKVEREYGIGSKVKGTITNITDYGAFVELAPGVEGLIHVSEMSWTRKNVHPGKMVSTSEEVEVMVLEIDRDKRRISLGLKQCAANPWESFAGSHKEGDEVEGVVRSITDFGIFIGLNDDIDGLVHMSDLSWEKSNEEALQEFKKGDTVKAKILAIDADKERVSLGVKQMSEDKFGSAAEGLKKGDVVKATITEVEADGLKVTVDGTDGYIKRADLSRNKDKQDTNSFKAGDEVEAKILSVSNRDRRVNLSIKAKEVAEEREAVKNFANDEVGATLGDALGDALKAAKK